MLQEKLQNLINTECNYADKNGTSKLSTCDHYNWDKDVWAHKESIIDTIQKRGYNVNVSVSYGVTDIITTKQIQLS